MYEDIRQQFNEVISYSQGIENPQTDILFKRWFKAKKKFIDRFGGLIFEWPTPVEFTLDAKEKRTKAMEFANCVHDAFNNMELAEFLDQNIDSFFDNKVSYTLGKNIPEGMKLIKAFKFFENDKAALRNIQDMASQLIQENKIKGTLCFSVHPLDFLSSSENTYNWRSCHALDGEYRAGNLSYMVDEVTFMVYLRGADNVYLPSFNHVKWNSKKWRMLIHASLDDKIMFAGRQYPFNSKSGMDTVLNVYNNIRQQGCAQINPSWFYKYHSWRADYVNAYVSYDGDPLDSIELDTKYFVFNGHLIDLNEAVKAGYNSLNYNDVLHSTCYTFPYYAILNPFEYYDIQNIRNNPIMIGEEVGCLYCENELITESETMRCSHCELEYGFEENDTYGSCACCDRRIYLDDAISVGDYSELVCDGCFHELCFVCDDCGGVYYKNHSHFVSIDEEEEEWYCDHCYDNYMNNDRRDY